MGQALSISALARSTGITSKTLRHWERVGLLPKAARTHTGYRIFGAESTSLPATGYSCRTDWRVCWKRPLLNYPVWSRIC